MAFDSLHDIHLLIQILFFSLSFNSFTVNNFPIFFLVFINQLILFLFVITWFIPKPHKHLLIGIMFDRRHERMNQTRILFELLIFVPEREILMFVVTSLFIYFQVFLNLSDLFYV